MGKQYKTDFVSWRDAKRRPFGWFPGDATYSRAAASALEERLNELAEDGWIVDRIIPNEGLTPEQRAGFTIISFK